QLHVVDRVPGDHRPDAHVGDLDAAPVHVLDGDVLDRQPVEVVGQGVEVGDHPGPVVVRPGQGRVPVPVDRQGPDGDVVALDDEPVLDRPAEGRVVVGVGGGGGDDHAGAGLAPDRHRLVDGDVRFEVGAGGDPDGV